MNTLYGFLEQLSKYWNNLNDVNKKNISTLISGQR
nr:MAG TPA: hypothetical protein [Caudoviricetes sp.]